MRTAVAKMQEGRMDTVNDALAQKQFDANWADWCAGGPKPGGYTRSGRPIRLPPLKLVGMQQTALRARDVIAKNPREFRRWHIAFLRTHLAGGKWADTAYFREYLLSRLTQDSALARAEAFVQLFEDVRRDGISVPVRVAYVGRVLNFPYFRFDGAHRTACAHVLGIDRIEAIVHEGSGGEVGRARRWLRGQLTT
jgi:hypothetical protein